ncbi:MAG: hypothetical protein C0485_18030 [Pirellula sp.]|nr:hypothetical protein [Pirellula sp.]
MAKKKTYKGGAPHITVSAEPEQSEANAEELARERFLKHDLPAYLHSDGCGLQLSERLSFPEIFESCESFLVDLAIASDAAKRLQKRGVSAPETREYALTALVTGRSILADLQKPARKRQSVEWYVGRVLWFDKQLMYAIDKLKGMDQVAKREAARQKRAGDERCKLKTSEDKEKALEIILRFYKPPRVKKTPACLRAVPVVWEEMGKVVGDRTLRRLLDTHLKVD